MNYREFLNKVFGGNFWWEEEKIREELKNQLENQIPVCGRITQAQYIQQEDETSERVHYQEIRIYLVTTNGSMWRPEKEIDFSSPYIQVMLGSILGIPSHKIRIIYEQRKTKPDRLNYFNSFSWRFTSIPMSNFGSAYEKFQVRVVADVNGYPEPTGFPEDAYRIVFPESLKIKQAEDGFDFDLDKTQVRLVRFHNWFVEYITPEGIRVFDYREGKKNTNIDPLAKRALAEWVETLQPKKGEKKIWFAWKMLHALASGEIRGHNNKLFQGLKAFTGSEFIAAAKLFVPCSFEKRMIFKNTHWSPIEQLYLGTDIFHPGYVIIQDPQGK